MKNQAAQKQVKITLKIADDLPSQADTDKTAWVLVNFLVNAIRYSPENGEVIVEIKRKTARSGSRFRTLVGALSRSTKTGFFERYFRVPGSENRASGWPWPLGRSSSRRSEAVLAWKVNWGLAAGFGSN